ncbi:MAG TPA: hypothetical protein VMI54_13700 [Polyangiaceae bacterium]|nr:hypothetical protein [Polyangiaceae bacterium]
MRTSRLLLVLAGTGVALVAALGVAAFLALPGFIEREVESRSREQGLALSYASLDFGWNWAELKQVKATLVGVDGLTLAIDRLDADLDFLKLLRVDLTGVNIDATGSLPALGLALGAWSKRYATAFSLPLFAKSLGAAWRPDATQPPWLELTEGNVASTPGGSIVTAEHAKIAGLDAGRIGATWIPTATSVALGLGETDLARAPLRVTVDLSAPKPRVGFELAVTPLERLAGPLAVALPVHGVSLGVSAGFEFPAKEASLPELGAVHAELHGFVPPHPAELDGFVFGDVTTVETNLTFAPDGKSVALTGTRLTAGRFVLDGGGSLVRTADAATFSLDMHGALPCDALASAAAESRVGRLLGRAQGARAGSVARQAIGGSVGVRVQVSASTNNLAGASVKRSIGIGCGLKPLSLADVARLGETLLPSDLSELTDDVQKLTPKLPDGTPLVPSALLPLPPVPKIAPLFPPVTP